ncbi:sugar transferase [Microbacteriaceae bacterium VKM Ac-2854]|nr:sugar transferase [Microbacteriaceae bacterium VKM Ac-2854]
MTVLDQVGSSEATEGTARRRPWSRDFARKLVVTDVIVVLLSVFGSQLIWFGAEVQQISVRGDLAAYSAFLVSYWVVSAVIAIAWLLLLNFYATRDDRILGTDTTEFRRILSATLLLFAAICCIAYFARIEFARGYISTALPAGLILLWVSRALWRMWLRRQRRAGRYSSLVALVGSPATVEHTARELAKSPAAGYRVVAACIPEGVQGSVLTEHDIRVFEHMQVEQITSILAETGADTVVITSSDHLPPEKIRQLSWSLEPGRQHLVMAPSLTDVSGPRIHTRPVAGLPLIHIETPRYEGSKRATKRAFDLLGSSALLLVLSPVFLVVAIAIKISSPGPVFYSNERIGLNGQPFGMLKFRSMIVNANDMLADLLKEQGTSEKPLFKIQNDPRITPIGRFIRKYSIDEVPQLVNVFRGDMSLVGPRPQVKGEVELYDDAARRRLIVKPGMTGLWQVSGRSTLEWEDAVRLDLYYVENWSVTGDIALLFRTVKAVVAPGEDAH